MSDPFEPPTCPVAHHARERPGAEAVVWAGGTWTYEELDAAAARAGQGLQKVGDRRGIALDRVGLHMPRGPRYVALLVALWRLGAVAVPLSTRLPARGLDDHLERAGADLLIAGEAPPPSAVGPVPHVEAGAVAPGPGEAVEEAAKHEPVKDNAGEGRRSDPAPTIPLDRPVSLVFTSGSTGTPKAALHTWGNHVWSARGSASNLPVEPGDRWLLSLPLYHVGGLAIVIRCLVGGAAVAIPSPETSVGEAADRLRATHLSLVATQLQRLLRNSEGGPADRLRGILCGGGAIPEGLLREAHERGWPVHTTYGCTEMGSQVTTTPPGASVEDLMTAGCVLPHRAVKIAEDGQILVRGATLFQGYVRSDGLDAPRTADGWYPTGDVGHFDAEERLCITGRVDRQFVSGGENVQPEEIEAALEALSEVTRAVVVPVDDPEYGSRPVAFLRGVAAGELGDARRDAPAGSARPIGESAANRVRARLRDALPGFKVPDALYHLPESAEAGSLKIDRAALQRRAERARASRSAGS